MRRLGRGLAVCAVALMSCGGGADELLDTARFEERQNNLPRARALYEDVLRRYPDTPEAATAAARLRALAVAPEPEP